MPVNAGDSISQGGHFEGRPAGHHSAAPRARGPGSAPAVRPVSRLQCGPATRPGVPGVPLLLLFKYPLSPVHCQGAAMT